MKFSLESRSVLFGFQVYENCMVSMSFFLRKPIVLLKCTKEAKTTFLVFSFAKDFTAVGVAIYDDQLFMSAWDMVQTSSRPLVGTEALLTTTKLNMFTAGTAVLGCRELKGSDF